MLKSALLLTVGVGLGASAIQGLYAAGGPAAYTVYEANVKDEAAYKAALPDVLKMIKEDGGVYIAGGFNKTTTDLGTAAGNRYVIVKWENKAAWEKAWNGGVKAWVLKHAPDARNITVEATE
jgi:uncharacterized protein (DUF1330 family)